MCRRLAVVLVVLCSAWSAEKRSAWATVPYVVTDLGTLGGTPSVAYDISENGQVAGWSGTGTTPHAAFLYSGAGPMQDLSSMQMSIAYGVNDAGQVTGVGMSATGLGGHALLYGGSWPTLDLGTFGGTSSIAYGINNSGQVVGKANISGDTAHHAFLYSGSGPIQDMGTLGGQFSEAWRINDNGQIVGQAATRASYYHAFLYNGGTMQDLGTLGGSDSDSYACGLNNSGQVVGWANTGTLAEKHAFLYSGGTIQDLLGTLGGTYSLAMDINDSGQIVGQASTVGAFLYTSSAGMQDLNGLISPVSGWHLNAATSINNRGQIVGNGYISAGQTHAILLTPASPGDANLDGIVNMTDLNIAITNGGKSGMDWSQGDFNSDGTVDIGDINRVLTNYEKVAAGSGGTNAVPEPSSIMILLAGAACGLVARVRWC